MILRNFAHDMINCTRFTETLILIKPRTKTSLGFVNIFYLQNKWDLKQAKCFVSSKKFDISIFQILDQQKLCSKMLIVTSIFALILSILFIRLSICLPMFKLKRKRKVNGSKLTTMVVLGSGKKIIINLGHLHYLLKTSGNIFLQVDTQPR